MGRVKYSIITAVYNHKHYMLQMGEALENQTEKDFEWIIADDGSTDGTKQFFENLDTKLNFKYVRQSNRGMRLAKVINKGIKQAQGQYCVFIMGDSFPELNYLETLNDYVNEDYILCGIRNQIDEGRAVDVDWRIKKGLIPQDARVLIDTPYNKITGNGLVIPTSALRKHGGWDKNIKGYGGDDNELAARLYYKGYIFWSLPNAIIYHHWHKAKYCAKNNLKYINKLILKYAKRTT